MTHTSEIKINRPLATHLLGIAQNSPDAEVCGLVGGVNGRPTTVYPIKNIATNSDVAFEMDAQAQIDAFKAIRANNENLFAVYHSHPSSPPLPSKQDIEQFGYADAFYLIISLNTKGVLEMRAFTLENQTVNAVSMSL